MIDYVQYSYANRWTDYSSDPLPTFLIICPNETTKRHLYKTIEYESPSTPFYLTTKETIQESGFKEDRLSEIIKKIETHEKTDIKFYQDIKNELKQILKREGIGNAG